MSCSLSSAAAYKHVPRSNIRCRSLKVYSASRKERQKAEATQKQTLKKPTPSSTDQLAASERAQTAVALAQKAKERAQESAEKAAAAAAAAPKPSRAAPPPPTPIPTPKSTERTAPAEDEPEAPNYAFAIASFLVVILAFYGFAAGLSTVLVEALFPMIYGIK
eukprot:CAMPEP_0114261062 /NCGR_PEP_ID=MMETSP0058-20121206/20887_1 /TAXON_ID=36894 /ORGANISM="Pyramimonas parkeae, CCMP726" /LENGTH=162 /DNA_ID=CAMNT_0001376473 /DNA_START=49 /DNA_END=537 /DNA_ORIENTATION=+